MGTPIRNQASLAYKSGTVDKTIMSNIASVTLQNIIDIDKTSLENSYRIGETVVYNILFQNTSSGNLTKVTLTDDLGTYDTDTKSGLTPLTYEGPAKEYRNGVLMGTITPEIASNSIKFTLNNVAAYTRVLIQYKVRINDFSPAALDDNKIKNTVIAEIGITNESFSDSNEIPLDNYEDVSIDKEMAPDPISPGDRLIYKFSLANSGTASATNIVLTDTFKPAPKDLHVFVDGIPTTDYDYDDTTGKFRYPSATGASVVNLNGAEIVQDATTGHVTVNPYKYVIMVSGKIS